MSEKAQVVALIKSIESGDHAPIASINPTKYIQHNQSVGDGLAGFGAVMKQLPPGSARAKPVRAFQDGDMVFAHTDYNFFGPKIGFDIFRFENGKIVEHWDNLQEKSPSPNPNGHTMTDGPTEATDLHMTKANKALVRAFVTDVLMHGKMDVLPRYIEGDAYIQHNPNIADGVSGLGAAMAAMAKQGVTMKYDAIHRVLGEGNFVLAVSEGSLGGTPTSFYDLFRVENGKIAEHWDVVAAILPPSEAKNINGKF